jgi:hypothetical protein
VQAQACCENKSLSGEARGRSFFGRNPGLVCQFLNLYCVTNTHARSSKIMEM